MRKWMTALIILYTYWIAGFMLLLYHRMRTIEKYTWTRLSGNREWIMLACMAGLGFVLFILSVIHLAAVWEGMCRNEEEHRGTSIVTSALLVKLVQVPAYGIVAALSPYLSISVMPTVLLMAGMLEGVALACSGLFALPVYHRLAVEGSLTRADQIACSILSFVLGADVTAAVYAYAKVRGRK